MAPPPLSSPADLQQQGGLGSQGTASGFVPFNALMRSIAGSSYGRAGSRLPAANAATVSEDEEPRGKGM